MVSMDHYEWSAANLTLALLLRALAPPQGKAHGCLNELTQALGAGC